MNDSCIIIPAVKKNVAFADDLVKKLHGITLIQRTIDKAAALVARGHIYVVTDSEEISLIARRCNVRTVYKQSLLLKTDDIIRELRFFLVRLTKQFQTLVILWPYSPLLRTNDIIDAMDQFRKNRYDVMVSVKEEKHRIFEKKKSKLHKLILSDDRDDLYIEQKAFSFLSSDLLTERKNAKSLNVHPYYLPSECIEIRNYQDWWVCEKLLRRKRIVFRVIGYDEVGMGHIYRSLALAHEVTDHEVIFLTDARSNLAVTKIAGYDYLIRTVAENRILNELLSLKPDLLINDVLNTDRDYIETLQRAGIKVVNFEDLGPGAASADLTINELFDEPQMQGDRIQWGHRYFFLRDEFTTARPQRFQDRVSNLLITFGGTDSNNLTMKTVQTVVGFCRDHDIGISVVAGQGYKYKKELTDFLKTIVGTRIEFTYATGIMSEIMERSQVAISSNGRTVYELAHMHIPSIIVSHHERENTHLFSSKENGFINLGAYRQGESEALILESLKQLVEDADFRRAKFDKMLTFDFTRSKSMVVDKILSLLDDRAPGAYN